MKTANSPAKLFASSSFRLALIYWLLFSVSVLILFGFFYWSTAATLAQQADTTIEAEITGLSEQYERRGLSGLRDLINERVTRQQPTGSSIYLLTDFTYRRLAGNLNRWPKEAQDIDGWLDFELTDETSSEVYPARAQPFRLRGGYRLLVGRDIRELKQTQKQIIQTLAWGLGITLVLGIMGGILMSRSMVRRIETMNQTSREIMAGNLSQRIPTRASNDEFDRLAANLNQMLDKIEDSVENVRRVSDNIAHDLKTPLARLRNKLDEAQREATGEAQRREILNSAVDEADNLLSTFNALLRIARIESEEMQAAFSKVDLAALLADVAELYEPLAEAKNQQLVTQLDKQITFRADRDLLFQAFANVVDNAVKHTPASGTIKIALKTHEDAAMVTISDSGPGIPDTMQEKVFRRFFRLDSSRNTTGSGLGLSLVAAVAKLHHIEIKLENTNPGLRFRFILPE